MIKKTQSSSSFPFPLRESSGMFLPAQMPPRVALKRPCPFRIPVSGQNQERPADSLLRKNTPPG